MSEFNTSKKVDLLARAMAIRAIPKPSIIPPTDKTLLWLDSNTAPYSLKYYDPNIENWIAVKGFDDPDYNPAYPEVSNFESLPPANEHIGQIYVVLQSTGIYLINRHERGLYFSNGATWTRLGNIPEYFRDDIFEIYDNDEPTRAVQFQVGNVSNNTKRQLAVQDRNGTIALDEDFANYELVLQYINYTAPGGDLYAGTIESGTQNTLTDNDANWTVDEWVDKIVRIKRNGGSDFEYGVVLSNTNNTITFDDDLIFIPCNLCTYEIINTLETTHDSFPLMIAFDVRLGQCGLLLPKVDPAIERKYVHAYIERATDGLYTVPIICRGTDRQFGAKYGELIHQTEGVRLHAHTWMSDHWDITQVFNVKRLATGYFNNSITVNNTNWMYVANDGILIYDNVKRFLPYVREGQTWLRYTSLLQREFYVSFTAIVNKTGSTGELDITLAKRDGETGIVTFLDNRISTTQFGGGDGVETINVEVPVTLKRNDEIIPVSRRTAGIFSIGDGSSIKVVEF